MGRKLIDLSREISHMMPVANPHINQVPAFWDRLTHEQTKGRWKHADIIEPILMILPPPQRLKVG